MTERLKFQILQLVTGTGCTGRLDYEEPHEVLRSMESLATVDAHKVCVEGLRFMIPYLSAEDRTLLRTLLNSDYCFFQSDKHRVMEEAGEKYVMIRKLFVLRIPKKLSQEYPKKAMR